MLGASVSLLSLFQAKKKKLRNKKGMYCKSNKILFYFGVLIFEILIRWKYFVFLFKFDYYFFFFLP